MTIPSAELSFLTSSLTSATKGRRNNGEVVDSTATGSMTSHHDDVIPPETISSLPEFPDNSASFLDSSTQAYTAEHPIQWEKMTPETHEPDHTTIYLVIGAVIFVCLVVVVVVILLCLRRMRRRRNKRKDQIAARYDIFSTLRRPTPVEVTPTKRQLNHAPRSIQSSYNSFDLVSEHPQMEETYTMRKISEGANVDRMARYHSIEGPGSDSPKKKTLKKSKSIPALLKASTIEPEFNPSISFSLKYDAKSRQLKMKLLRVADLPIKCYGYDVNAVVYLFPRNVDGVHSRCVLGGKDIVLNETFLFDDMTLVEVEKSTLRLVVQYQRKMRPGKENFVGELYLKCGECDWTESKTLTFNHLTLGSKVKNGTPEKYMMEDMGSLFVCLEYQTSARRLKVMVRKASNLPKSDKLIGDPGHYVVIHLLKKREITKVQETKSHSGYNPIWNQPFLFDLDSGAAETNYSLDFVIMRKKRHTKDAVVGHVIIGEYGCRSGRNHWKEIMSPRPVETAKWHAIAPVLDLKHYARSSFDE